MDGRRREARFVLFMTAIILHNADRCVFDDLSSFCVRRQIMLTLAFQGAFTALQVSIVIHVTN